MAHTVTQINPTTNESLLSNLGLAIDEAKLVTLLTNLSNELYGLEKSGGNSIRTNYIRNEISIIESQLSIIRILVEHRQIAGKLMRKLGEMSG